MPFITFTALAGVAGDAQGVSKRYVRALGSPDAIDAIPGSAWGRARRQLRSAGTPQAGYAGGPLAPSPELPVFATATRRVVSSGVTVSSRAAEAEHRRRIRTRGFAFYGAGMAAGDTRRRIGTRGAPPTDGGLFLPDPVFVEGFANRAFETHMAFVTAEDTMQATHAVLLAARVLAAVSPTVRARMRSDLPARVLAGDRLALWFLEQLADTAAATDTLEDRARHIALLVDTVLVEGEVSTYAAAVQQLAAAVVAASEASAFALAEMQDGAVAYDTVLEHLRVLAELIDTALAADEVSTKQRMTIVLADESAAAGALDTTLSAFQLLQQGAQAAVTLLLDSGVYVAWTYNMQSSGVTRYENYPFNSFAKIGTEYYGLTSTGLYRLGGDTDDGVPIKAKIRLGMTDMGTRKMKRLPEVFMGYTGDGRMVLRVIYVDDKTGEKVGADYLMKPRPAGSKRESRFEPGKGLVAVDFDFELENIDGADFALTNIEFSPMVVDRRTRG